MMSNTLAHQFLLLLCFKLTCAMRSQSFGQPFWPNAPAYPYDEYSYSHDEYDYLPVHQEPMQYGGYPAYPPYGIQMIPQNAYPHHGAMYFNHPGYMQGAPFMGPPGYQPHMPSGYMTPTFPSYQPAFQPQQQPIAQSLAPFASLNANSRSWDQISRSFTTTESSTSKLKSIPTENVEIKSVEVAASVAQEKPEALSIETKAGETIVVTEESGHATPSPAKQIGPQSTWAPKTLKPLTKSSSSKKAKTPSKAKQGQAYIPKIQQTIPQISTPVVQPAVVEPAAMTKPASVWGTSNLTQLIKSKNYMPIEQHLRHVIYYLDPVEYKRAYESFIDPRDLAFAYIMFGQRLWNNILYPLARSLGTEFTAMLCHDINSFESAFNELEQEQQTLALNSTYIDNLTLAHVQFAIRMYRNRLRICHPKQFPRKFKGGKQVEDAANRSVQMTHFDYLFKWTGKNQVDATQKSLQTGYSLTQTMINQVAHRAHITEEQASIYGQQANFGGSRKASVNGNDVLFAKEAEIDTTLALLYIWDHHRPTGNNQNSTNLRFVRNQMAHQEGSDQMYAAYVKAIFHGQPQFQQLLMVCNRSEDLNYEIQQYQVDESVQYEDDGEIEVIQDRK